MARPRNLIPMPQGVPSAAPGNIIQADLRSAGVTPRLDAQAAIAPAEGMAQVGKGLQGLGAATVQLAEKVRQAKAITSDFDSSQMIEKAQDDIAIAYEKVKLKDPDAWEGIQRERFDQLSKDLQSIKADPETRAIIDKKFQASQIRTSGVLGMAAAKAHIGNAKTSVDQTLDYATATQDKQLFRDTILKAKPEGYVTDEEEKIRILHFDQTGQKQRIAAQKSMLLGAAQADPHKALELVESDNSLSPEMKQYGKEVALAGIRQQATIVTTQANEEIGKGFHGELSVPDDVDKWAKTHPGFTEGMKAKAKAHIEKMNNASTRAYVAERAGNISSQIDTDITMLDPNTAKPDDYAGLAMQIKLLPTEFQKFLTERLNSRYNRMPLPESRDMVAAGMDQSRQMLVNGELGKWYSMEEVKDVDGKTVIVPSTGLPKTKKVIDPSALQQAKWTRAEMDRKFRDWNLTHPKASTNESAEYIRTLVPESTRANWAAETAKQTDAEKTGLFPGPGEYRIAPDAAGPPDTEDSDENQRKIDEENKRLEPSAVKELHGGKKTALHTAVEGPFSPPDLPGDNADDEDEEDTNILLNP